MRSTYTPGSWKVICYVCGRERKAGELSRHWQGYWVCEEDWEVRHPQDFVRATVDHIQPPWTQPEPVDEFIAFCTPNGLTAICDYAVADCCVCDYISPLFDGIMYTQPGPSCTFNGMSAIAGVMISDCAVSGYVSPLYNPLLP
jgi:hypothetical protein